MGSSRQTRHNLDENKDVPSTAATSGASATPSSPVWYYFIFFMYVDVSRRWGLNMPQIQNEDEAHDVPSQRTHGVTEESN